MTREVFLVVKELKLGPDLGKVGATHNHRKISNKLHSPKKTNLLTDMPTFRDMPKNQRDALIKYLEQLR